MSMQSIDHQGKTVAKIVSGRDSIFLRNDNPKKVRVTVGG